MIPELTQGLDGSISQLHRSRRERYGFIATAHGAGSVSRDVDRINRMKTHSVQPGVAQSRVIELLGGPDAKADSSAAKNWLYRYDAALNDDQVWIATLTVAITEGTVTKAETWF